MATKKEVRAMNAAKNKFVKWLEKNEAQEITIFNALDPEWNYYKNITGICHKGGINVCFMMIFGACKIEGHIGDESFELYSTDEFIKLLK